MKVLTVKYYLCEKGHKHTSKRLCKECDERTNKVFVPTGKKYIGHHTRLRRMETALYLHGRGEDLPYIARALGLAVSTTRDILTAARTKRRHNVSLEVLVDYKPEWIIWASKMVAGEHCRRPNKISERDVELWRWREAGLTHKQLAEKFNIHPSRVGPILNRLDRVWRRHRQDFEDDDNEISQAAR